MITVEADDMAKIDKGLGLIFVISAALSQYEAQLVLGGSTVSIIYWVALAVGLVVAHNWILSLAKGYAFPTIFGAQRVVRGVFRLSLILTVLGLVSWVLVRFQLWAIAIAAMGLLISYTRVMNLWREGKLSIRQFFCERRIKNYSFLKNGLEILASRMEEVGIFVDSRKLFLGASFSLLEAESAIEAKSGLQALSEWVSQSADERMNNAKLLNATSLILVKAKEAKKMGITVRPTMAERFGLVPWDKISYLLVVIIALVALLLGRQVNIP